MILPTKHIRVSESLFGLGAYILNYIKSKPLTIDDLWKKIIKLNKSKTFDAYHGFDDVVLALNYLFVIGAIDLDTEDRIYNAIN